MAVKKSIFVSLREGYSYLDSLQEAESFRKEVLDELNEFVFSGLYTKYRDRRAFLDLENKYADTEVIASKMGISEGGVRQARKRISEDAYKYLGSDVVDRILHGSEKECKIVQDNIRVITYTLSDNDVLLNHVKKVVKNSYIGSGTEEFDLRDCKNEIVLLSMFTMTRLDYLLENIDYDKMDYLVRLLDNKVIDSTSRMTLLKYLSSRITLKDTVVMLNDLVNMSKNNKSINNKNNE